MKNKVLYNFLLIVGGVFLVSLAALSVLALRGGDWTEKPRYDEEIHDRLVSAMDSGDYEKWIKIRKENGLPMHGRMFRSLDEGNFELFREMHEAKMNGDYERLAELREDLGLEREPMHRASFHERMRERMGLGMHAGS